jgi:C-methyltransferase C-terminal domain/Putative zinc binding domain/Methyltransferase domain
VRAQHHLRTTCRLCDSSNIELVVELAPIPLAEKYLTESQLTETPEFYPADLYLCRACGHVQILDVIAPEYLWHDYTYHSGQTRGIVDHFEKVADGMVRRYQPAAKSLVIDIGSNDGSLLRPFKARDLRVLGIDPAKEIANQATANGIETLPQLMTPELARKIRQERGPASIITAFNVFAHADDMAGMGESVRLMLAPDGVFLFEVQYLADIIDRMLLGTIFHEHLCHHSVKPMRQFLNRHGMELIDIERVTIQKGSLIGTVQHLGGPHSVQPIVAEMLALEKERRLDQPATIRVFADRLKKLKAQAQQLVAQWKRQGKSIAGYGAARSGPTLIAQLGLENSIQYIVDDHPQKVHKFTPGHHIQVLPTSELLKRMPDYVILLAWIHAEKIIANNRAYLERGGHFVVCCPEIEVVSADQRVTFAAAAA